MSAIAGERYLAVFRDWCGIEVRQRDTEQAYAAPRGKVRLKKVEGERLDDRL